MRRGTVCKGLRFVFGGTSEGDGEVNGSFGCGGEVRELVELEFCYRRPNWRN